MIAREKLQLTAVALLVSSVYDLLLMFRPFHQKFTHKKIVQYLPFILQSSLMLRLCWVSFSWTESVTHFHYYNHEMTKETCFSGNCYTCMDLCTVSQFLVCVNVCGNKEVRNHVKKLLRERCII